ncbi:MAG TPA: fused MFS/spermidine synthase [Fimbriimonadaceae bacterium]|nr:fused MFS/spermidine synthase [Fimbriimonadaceae bacterium]
MRILFTVTLFLSSMLLFLIEPMIAKMILPRFGGSPGVWNTSLLFFQAALLAGYGYAHIATKYLGPRIQAITHIAVLVLPVFLLPFALPHGVGAIGANPAPLVLLVLTVSVGLPFLVVSAGAPLLQRWFAATKDPHAHDPYFLYAASNLGSMLALLSYPFLIEPRFSLSQQTQLWAAGYYALFVLMAVCAIAIWLSRGKDEPFHEAPPTMPAEIERPEESVQPAVTWKRRLFWIALAFCPSSLLLGVTTYLTSNIAPIPLLWVVPLALYLLTFIVAFARKQVLSSAKIGRFLPLLVVPLAFTLILEASEPELIVPLTILNLIVFFAASLMCHTELAENRPKAEHLTEFYFYVSLGGVLGGLFNALIAPALFNSFFEYPLVLAAACAFRPSASADRWKFGRLDWLYPIGIAALVVAMALIGRAIFPEPTHTRSAIMIGLPLVAVFLATDRPLRFAASLLVLFAGSAIMQVAVAGRIIAAKRSFFGVHRVVEYTNPYGTFHDLVHGNTIHGKENLDEKVHASLPPKIQQSLDLTPLTYYYPTGPIGQVFQVLGPSRHNVALVGLGIGSLAAYGQPGQKFTYYEIDPDVVELASDTKLFHFVHDCRASLKIDVGDARLELAKAPDASYDLIVLDAFSSDSIPMHLLTREAIQMYLTKLMPGGVLAFHISNRYLDLKPILGNEAANLGLSAYLEYDAGKEAEVGKEPSKWVVMARNPADFGELVRRNPDWDALEADPGYPLWTDDYSNLASVLRIGSHTDE